VNVVEVENVSKSYGGQPALSDVSLSIGPGEVFALLGPNGAGKTTLLRILTGILPPDSGTVRLLGASDRDAVRDHVGYLPEERGLYRRQTVGDTLAYLGELKGLAAKVARERARVVLEQVGMGAHFGSKPESLSKGMAQRIQIAAALVHDPPFVILDEPFSGLDPVSARQAHELVLSEKARGRTILLSTHQMGPVELLCDRLLMLHRGKPVLYGGVDEVRARFRAGLLRVEHADAFLPPDLQLPPGVTVEDTEPHITRLSAPGMPPRDVLAALIASGVDIRGFAEETPSLEEIFVRLVGEQG
jgi:ABC-2 type transport system ATP-binding protein